MNRFTHQRFIKQFPGPYYERPGHDGVDDIFDIGCVGSGQYIISTHYWHEVTRARQVAAIITAALNRQAGWHEFLPTTLASEVAAFRKLYPGRYGLYHDVCGYRCPFIGIRCLQTGESVIECDTTGARGEAKRICRYVALALSELAESYQCPLASGELQHSELA